MYVSNWSNFIGFGPPFTVVLLDLVVQSLSVCFVICDQKDDKAEVITNMPLMSYVLLYFSRQSFFWGGGHVQARTAKRLRIFFFELLGSKGVLII